MSVLRKTKLMSFPCISQCRIIFLLFCIISCIHTSFAFPKNNLRFSRRTSIETRQRHNDRPKFSNNILKRTAAKLQNGHQSLQILWNNIMYNTNQPRRRHSQLLASERKPNYHGSTPHWRSLMSKAWTYVTGFFRRPKNYIARRRMDTDKESYEQARL